MSTDESTSQVKTLETSANEERTENDTELLLETNNLHIQDKKQKLYEGIQNGRRPCCSSRLSKIVVLSLIIILTYFFASGKGVGLASQLKQYLNQSAAGIETHENAIGDINDSSQGKDTPYSDVDGEDEDGEDSKDRDDYETSSKNDVANTQTKTGTGKEEEAEEEEEEAQELEEEADEIELAAERKDEQAKEELTAAEKEEQVAKEQEQEAIEEENQAIENGDDDKEEIARQAELEAKKAEEAAKSKKVNARLKEEEAEIEKHIAKDIREEAEEEEEEAKETLSGETKNDEEVIVPDRDKTKPKDDDHEDISVQPKHGVRDIEWEHYEAFLQEVKSNAPKLCKQHILDVLSNLKATLDRRLSPTSKVPLIIGGVGDSGTRSMVDFLARFSIDFSKVSHSKDSKAYMAAYEVPSCLDPSLIRTTMAYTFYESIWHLTKQNFTIVRENLDKLGEDYWWMGTTFMLEALKRHVAEQHNSVGAWAIKQPRSTTMLPILKYLFGDQLRYIHVVRDFRDLASGKRKFFYGQLCQYFYSDTQTKRNICANRTLTHRLEFNAQWTIDSIKWLKDNLNPEQFLVVRIEDLVSGDIQTLERVLRFVTRSYPGMIVESQTILLEQKASFLAHLGSYNGLKYSPGNRKRLNKASSKLTTVADGMKLVGYHMPEDLRGTWTPLNRWTCDEYMC